MYQIHGKHATCNTNKIKEHKENQDDEDLILKLFYQYNDKKDEMNNEFHNNIM